MVFKVVSLFSTAAPDFWVCIQSNTTASNTEWKVVLGSEIHVVALYLI